MFLTCASVEQGFFPIVKVLIVKANPCLWIDPSISPYHLVICYIIDIVAYSHIGDKTFGSESRCCRCISSPSGLEIILIIEGIPKGFVVLSRGFYDIILRDTTIVEPYTCIHLYRELSTCS